MAEQANFRLWKQLVGRSDLGPVEVSDERDGLLAEVDATKVNAESAERDRRRDPATTPELQLHDELVLEG
jgi:hypothetical protein